MTTAPLPTSHQAATAAPPELLGSAPIWSEHDVDLARTLLLFGGAAAEAALLAWVEAQHAYPHALLAHVAGALSPGGQERVGRHVRAMCPGPWRDQALSRCVDYIPPSALNDLVSTVLAWQPREPASGDNDTITPHASATALRALGLALAAQQRVDAALALASSIADGHARVRAFAQLLKIVPTDLRDGLWREIVLMLRELDGASAFVALDEARADLIRGGQAGALISFLRDDKLPPFPRQTLLHHLVEDLQESRPNLALEAARANPHAETRARDLLFVMPRVPAARQETVLAEALAAARTIQDVASRAQLIASICGYLPKD